MNAFSGGRESMRQQARFLTAEWKNLVMFNYAVEPSLLEQYVPAGTEVDTFDGRTYISLVGFEFNQTRLSGIAVPFHRSFEEVNLRFYVRRASRRGVAFIREVVPKPAVAAVARFAFGENYCCAPMAHRVDLHPDGVEAEFSWGSGSDRCWMRIEAHNRSFLPPEGSLSQFITEHYWGYAAQSDGGCLEYEVQHPRWSVWKAKEAEFSGNAARFYGSELGRTLLRFPDSAFLAEGSPVTVFKGARIERRAELAEAAR
ncbi:MAG TPA: DUF2071 domain-containing protein [Terracidiphilus sp.]|nr:DUF2071 domain-containing protein [Terracidiphilus sp.]